MQSELKPCPFCGGEAELRGFQAPEFWVACPKVGCKAHTEGFGSKERAIAAWNTRASDTELARLTEALRAAEERENALREAMEAAADYLGRQEFTEDGHSIYLDTRAAIKEQPHD